MLVNPAAKPYLRLIVDIYKDREDAELAEFVSIIRPAEMQSSGRMSMQLYATLSVFGESIVGDSRCPIAFTA